MDATLNLAVDQEPIASTRAILCEGSGDKNLLQELIKARALPDFYITHPRNNIRPGGRQGFSHRLRGLRLQPGFDELRGIAIISDSDRDRDASFAEVRSQIHEAGFSSPNRELDCIAGPPAIVVLMVPIGELGQLETLCLRAIKDAWPTQFECAEMYAQCTGISTWGMGKQERAKLRALISHICKKDPNSSLTYLWHDGRETVIPLDHECFNTIAEFLRDFDALVAAAC